MAGEWRRLSIGDLCASGVAELQTGPFGSQLHAHDYVDEGVAVVPTEAIHDRRIDHSLLPKIPRAKAMELVRHRLRPGDILFARRGVQAAGHVGCVREAEDGFICGTGAIRLRVRELNSGISADFLSHVLANPASIEWFKSQAIGATMPNLNEGIIRSFRLALPLLQEQRAIARILGTLDDKIELNRRMNETLEAISRALFKCWFVDFDPVRAKAEGRDPGLPPHLADLFPDSFEDSELGEIPKGWEVQPFSDTIEIIGGGTPKTSVAEYWNGDIPWFSVADAPTASDVWAMNTEKTITRQGVERSSTRVLPVGTTIISARGTVGRVALVGVPMAMNQSCYGVLGKAGAHGFFTYFTVRELVVGLQQHAHGSVFDTITRDTLAGVAVARPPTALIEGFEEAACATMERLRMDLVESTTLAKARDSLLPKLISGVLRLKDVDRIMEAVSA
jgi:restriction endonuclease S subunit